MSSPQLAPVMGSLAVCHVSLIGLIAICELTVTACLQSCLWKKAVTRTGMFENYITLFQRNINGRMTLTYSIYPTAFGGVEPPKSYIAQEEFCKSLNLWTILVGQDHAQNVSSIHANWYIENWQTNREILFYITDVTYDTAVALKLHVTICSVDVPLCRCWCHFIHKWMSLCAGVDITLCKCLCHFVQDSDVILCRCWC